MTEIAAASPRRRWWRRGYTIALIVLAGLLLRAWAAWQLPLDADEPVYMQAASDYATRIKAGDLQAVINYPGNREHPPLVKLLYSLPFNLLPHHYDSSPQLYFNRGLSVVFGTLVVLMVSLIDPLAGAFVAGHSMAIKYTSEVYLEALPMAASWLAVLAFRQAQTGRRRWLWISAVALGVAAASKYTYLVVVPVIGFLALEHRPLRWRDLLAYGLIALAAFWLLNPTLWHDPFQRLRDSLFFHAAYTQGRDVARAAYPWYQPLVWISNDVPWHPQVFFFFTADRFVFWFLLPGLYLAWRQRQRWIIVWVGVALVTLLLWPTKWPQYTLIMTVPLCLAAALAVRAAVTWVKAEDAYWNWIDAVLPHPPRWVWYLIAILGIAVTVGKVTYEFQMAQARRGWSHFTADTAPLPSNTVHDIAIGQDGTLVLATDNGVALWRPSQDLFWGNGSSIYTPANAGLPSGRVLRVLQARDGTWWFGTDAGVAHYDGQTWTVYRAAELGLTGAQVRALAEDAYGQLWAGTLTGMAHWDGNRWRPLTQQTSGLLDDYVFVITAQGESLWFGSQNGVSHLDLTTQTWQTFDQSQIGLSWGGITDLLIDAEGRLWATTQGDGLALWDGSTWTCYRVNNSQLPSNTVNRVLEISPGQFWLALGYPTEPGGVIAYGQGTNWQKYTSHNSGFADFEPLSLAVDAEGGVWIGTATGGVQRFKAPAGEADQP